MQSTADMTVMGLDLAQAEFPFPVIDPDSGGHSTPSEQARQTELRCVVARDDTARRITFLTNNFAMKPERIADLCGQALQAVLTRSWLQVSFALSRNRSIFKSRCAAIRRLTPPQMPPTES
jgi:hypothetical protein